MNGAFPTAWPTPPRRWARRSERAGHLKLRGILRGALSFAWPAAFSVIRALYGPARDFSCPRFRRMWHSATQPQTHPDPGGRTVSDSFKTLDELDLGNKRVLLRADLNVPVANGRVTDATRIERLVPTIREIVKKDGKAILLSHFGRPKGKADAQFSLGQVWEPGANEPGHPVGFVATDWDDVRGARAAIDDAPAGSVLVLENTRFHPGEEDNDVELAKRMASLGDVYVNDAFSAAHRA